MGRPIVNGAFRAGPTTLRADGVPLPHYIAGEGMVVRGKRLVVRMWRRRQRRCPAHITSPGPDIRGAGNPRRQRPAWRGTSPPILSQARLSRDARDPIVESLPLTLAPVTFALPYDPQARFGWLRGYPWL